MAKTIGRNCYCYALARNRRLHNTRHRLLVPALPLQQQQPQPSGFDRLQNQAQIRLLHRWSWCDPRQKQQQQQQHPYPYPQVKVQAPIAVPNQFFGTRTNSGEDEGEENSLSPGQASITFAGVSDDADDVDLSATTMIHKDQHATSLFTIPIVIEMPRVDEHETETEHENENENENSFVETWHKQPGDFLERDDILCDISTPEFVFGMQIDDEQAGIMGEIHAEEGVRVPCHTPICTIYHKEGEDGDGDGDGDRNN